MRKAVNFRLFEYEPINQLRSKQVRRTEFHIEFEFTVFPELIADVERTMYEICKAYLENIDMLEVESAPKGTEVVVEATVCGIELEARDKLTDDFYTKKKKHDLNIDSLKNDIAYINSILTSAQGIKSDEYHAGLAAAAGIIHESRRWMYHIMNKHFDEPIPEGFEPDAPVEAKPVDKR